MRAVLSHDPVTTCRLSGVTQTEVTLSVWPSSLRTSLPLASSHTRAVLSFDPVTTCRPSGVTQTERTSFVWPFSVSKDGGSPKRSTASRPQPAFTSALRPASRSDLISSPRNSSTSVALRTTL